jgi:hypothetical protein
MAHTLELLEKALTVKRAAHWCDEFNIDLSTISKAKQRGRLSPTLAGNFAMKLGEDPAQWIAIAALEAEPQSTLLDALKTKSGVWRKR